MWPYMGGLLAPPLKQRPPPHTSNSVPLVSPHPSHLTISPSHRHVIAPSLSVPSLYNLFLDQSLAQPLNPSPTQLITHTHSPTHSPSHSPIPHSPTRSLPHLLRFSASHLLSSSVTQFLSSKSQWALVPISGPTGGPAGARPQIKHPSHLKTSSASTQMWLHMVGCWRPPSNQAPPYLKLSAVSAEIWVYRGARWRPRPNQGLPPPQKLSGVSADMRAHRVAY